ncbi:MAG: hypothetical protein B6I28_04220 [Fusobacteriia bacterium 4572_132]|nr:MAG: hypothetical protein B6I28_04220 [Fusobacteriia bacterium 4572_132]
MKKLNGLKIILLFSIILSSIAFAEEDDKITGTYYRNIRGMGMGNSYTTSALNEAALLYNPAMLNYLKKSKWSIFSPGFGINTDGMDSLPYLEEIISDVNDGKLDTMNEAEIFNYIKNKQNEMNNKMINGYAGNFTGILMKNIGMGVFVYGDINKAGIENPVNPKLILDSSINVDVPIGIATKIGPFRIGASARYINYLKTNAEITSADFLNPSEQMFGATKHEGFGINLGSVIGGDKFRIGIAMQDAFTKIDVWEDSKTVYPEGHEKQGKVIPDDELDNRILIDNYFSNEDLDGNSEIPRYTTYYKGEQKVMPNLRIGMAMYPKKWLQLSFDYENLLNEDMDGDGSPDDNPYKKIHVGSEISMLSDTFNLKFRLGINQGYPTMGVYAQPLYFMGKAPTWVKIVLFPAYLMHEFEFELVDYTEELGPYAGMKPNHIKALGFSLRF